MSSPQDGGPEGALIRAVMVFQHARKDLPVTADDLLAFLSDYLRDTFPAFSAQFWEKASAKAVHAITKNGGAQ